MKFLIQHNMINITDLGQIKDALIDYPHEFVGVIPFSREITSDVPLEGVDYIPYGSTAMSEVGLEYGWKGLHFDLAQANYGAFIANRDDMLNDNVIRLDEAVKFLETRNPRELWFTRPSKDLKEYTGMVDSAGDLFAWLKDRLECASSGSYQLQPDTMIVLSEPKNIDAEYRWFVVGGKVITGSMYRNNGQLFSQEQLDPDVIAEAQSFADKWLPDQCVVMDLALTDYGMKVIEFNCINSSGFYACNVKKIFDALWDYHNPKYFQGHFQYPDWKHDCRSRIYPKKD
jgi:hypothetical protein